jgi:glycosyltransferase involved in cell wall biosynthesis
MARTDFDPEISAWVHVAYKIADLYSFGNGGDSTINTRTPAIVDDSHNELHILAMDTSTWPMEPGGVSACRRDMINDLKTTKWHIVAEMANDYGVPRFQIERNVKSLTILPLWGLDFLNPTHGILQNSLDSAVVQRSFDTSTADIANNFIPILSSLVRCSRQIHLTRLAMEEATRALCDLNTYFESSRNWNDVWNSEIVKTTWRELWLNEEQPDTLKVSEWWDFEKPTLFQLDQALNMWHRYLFILSIPIPEKIPDIFQASHHFTGATYGILCKVKRNVTLHVWDHCISFREFTTFMSSAVSFDTPFVNSSLMSLGHLSCTLLEHHADVVLPCADYYNPGWEVELGTANGVLQHRRSFARKIDPVVNGICNMEKFEPIKEIKTETPTVVMLSHIQYVKDIKNAILATDLIVNKWGFKDYRLHVYGDMERAAGHTAECQELIASKGLGEHCVLKGLGDPSIVLQDAWVFLNSSISEGLPLAMGEAALTGVPVVCTDVGASFCVVTDRATGDAFSEVVPPNDSESLARAQINILALLGKWAPHAEDAPGATVPVLSYPNPTPREVKAISDRMYAKKDQRRILGMKGRENVLNNFSSHRYLREHEQMLWIGKHRSPAFRARSRNLDVGGSVTPKESSPWRSKEHLAFGASYTPKATPPRTPRLMPDRWDGSAPSSRAPSIISDRVKERLSIFDN